MFSQKYSRKQSISDWTEIEVARWLKSRGLGRFSRIFLENHINGKTLLCMKSQSLDNFSVNTPSSRDKLQAAVHELKLFGAAFSPDNKYYSCPNSTEKENSCGWSMHGRTNPVPGKARHRLQRQEIPEADNVCAKHRGSQRLREEKGSYSPNSKSRLRANRKKTAPLASSLATTTAKKGVVKVYAEILKADVQYKALEIYTSTPSKELVKIVLDKYDCRTKDPNLYYIAMETGVKNKDSGLPITQIIVLEEDSYPLELQESHPEGETKFHLKMRSGGLIMVRTSILTSGADFKSLYVARNTSSAEVVRLVLAGYDTDETPDSFCLREGSSDFAVDRLLSDDECPLHVQAQWKTGEQRNFNLTRKVSSKVTKDDVPNRVANNKVLQRELHNRDRTIEALRQAIRLMQQGSREQLGGRNSTEYSSKEFAAEEFDLADGSGIVSQQNKKEENRINNVNRGKQAPTEFRQKVKEFRQRNSALPNGSLAAVAVVQPQKRSKSTSSLNDIDDLDHVKAGSKRFNEPEDRSEKSLLSRNSSTGSIEKELFTISSPHTQIHKIKPTDKKMRSELRQGNSGKIGDDYTLYEVLQNKDLITACLARLPGEGLGIELAQVTETRPSKNTEEGRQQKADVLYIIHDEHGENVVLNDSQSSSSTSESQLGFRPISNNSSSRPRSVSLELNKEVSNSSGEQKPYNLSDEDALQQKLKQNLIARLNLFSPSSSCPSKPNSTNVHVHRPSNSPLPLRSSSALANWRSAGSPSPGPGVRIVGVAEGSAAALSGHLKEDDVIVEVNGKYLLNSTLDETIETLRESETVNIVVARERPSEIIDPPSPFAIAEMNQVQEIEESAVPSLHEETKALTEKVRELHVKLNEMQEELKKKDKKISSLKHSLEKKKAHSKVNDKHKYAETVQVMV